MLIVKIEENFEKKNSEGEMMAKKIVKKVVKKTVSKKSVKKADLKMKSGKKNVCEYC